METQTLPPEIPVDPAGIPASAEFAEHQAVLAAQLGRLASTDLHFEDISLAAEGFFGGRAHAIGSVVVGDTVQYRSSISHDGAPDEVVGRGETFGMAVIDTMRAMHSLETVKTKSILTMPMEGDKSIDFTSLEHYAPKIAPSNKIYEVPTYLKEVLHNTGGEGMKTYRETIATEGWSSTLFQQVESFLTADPRAQDLMRDLKITSLHALTPEQAVKLSLATVQRLSKYSRDTAGKPDGSRADGLTTMQLLQEGIDHSGEPDWEGNGVCRNVASNVKAVFESLKLNQGKLSMLHNTYSVYEFGADGDGYDYKREVGNAFRPNSSAHAWDSFITVDANGNANMAIVDATWALGSDPSQIVSEADYTLERMATVARKLFEKSDNKPAAFIDLNDYFRKLDRIVPGEGPVLREQRRQFVMTEYLKAAGQVVSEYDNDAPMPPTSVTRAAYGLKEQLQPDELGTLYTMGQQGMIENFDAILDNFLKGGAGKIVKTGRQNTLLVTDSDLQGLIFDKLGGDTALEYADQDGAFRIRLREVRPGFMAEFDPKSRTDQREIKVLADRNGLNLVGTSSDFGREVRRKLKAFAPDDETYSSLTEGRTDYELLRDYNKLATTLRTRSN